MISKTPLSHTSFAIQSRRHLAGRMPALPGMGRLSLLFIG